MRTVWGVIDIEKRLSERTFLKCLMIIKNFDIDSHIKMSTKYFEINQFKRPMYYFIAKNLLLLAQHSWVGNLYIKFAEIADVQKKY